MGQRQHPFYEPVRSSYASGVIFVLSEYGSGTLHDGGAVTVYVPLSSSFFRSPFALFSRYGEGSFPAFSATQRFSARHGDTFCNRLNIIPQLSMFEQVKKMPVGKTGIPN